MLIDYLTQLGVDHLYFFYIMNTGLVLFRLNELKPVLKIIEHVLKIDTDSVLNLTQVVVNSTTYRFCVNFNTQQHFCRALMLHLYG